MSLTEFFFPTTGVRSNQATLLAVDAASLPFRKGLYLELTKPSVRAAPVLRAASDPNAPDRTSADFYGTVLVDEGMFRMWYTGFGYTAEDPPADLSLSQRRHWWTKNVGYGPLCYAESDDGIEWRRPNLGQVEINGSRQNNALRLIDGKVIGATLVKDEDDPDDLRRYKMVFEGPDPQHRWTLYASTSPDGITWSLPSVAIDALAEQASFYRHNGLFIVNAHVPWELVRSEGGGAIGRQGFSFVSSDFDTWLEEFAESMVLAEPLDPADRGVAKPYVQVHLGVGAASFGNVAVGLYCAWDNQPLADNWFGYGTTSGDLVLCVSNDGIAFREPVRERVFLSRHDSPFSEPVDGEHETILTQANGILNFGDETRIYHGRWLNANDPTKSASEIALATLPRDRWGGLALVPGVESGSVWSAPIRLPRDAEVTLNALGAADMKVEIGDERFGLLPEFSGERGGVSAERDGLACGVRWHKSDFSRLAGETVRLRTRIARGVSDSRLFAVGLRRES